MMNQGILILMLIAVVAVGGRSLMEGECESPDDCQPGECCVLGMQRYSVPECRRLAVEDEDCLMEGGEPEDRMLYYPDNRIRWVTSVHTLMCPCSPSTLHCRQGKCTPKK